MLKQMAERMRTREQNQFVLPEEIDLKIKMLKKLLAALRGEKVPEADKIKPLKFMVL